ncbi:MAG TPA: peroxiredoxin [Myxococcaceae bacterium]|nr:peroxiredoxin [Myxococcaceae bacterium]
MLGVGDRAPDFEARDCQGRTVRLEDFRGRRLVLFFFTKAFTAGCTEEIRHFRDNQTRIRALGGELVGVSVDRPDVQCDFARSEKIEYPLLGDSDRKISDQFGVLWPLVRINRRVTFVVSPDGLIEEVIQHERQVWRHLDDVIVALEKPPGAPSCV